MKKLAGLFRTPLIINALDIALAVDATGCIWDRRTCPGVARKLLVR